MKKTVGLLILTTLGVAAPVSATPLIGPELAKFSILAGGYATYGAGANVSGEVGAVSYVTGGAGSVSAVDRLNTTGVLGALDGMAAAQLALNKLGTGTALGATMGGNQWLRPGVYSASALTTAAGTLLTLDGGGADNPYWVFNIPTYLVTGASTTIEIVNAGANASVIWNTGGYVAMGASTSFIGTVMSGAYISQGAGSEIYCGNLYAASYVGVGAGAHVTSTNCPGNVTWSGSEFGLGAGFDMVDGVARLHSGLAAGDETTPVDVPEPGTISMLLVGLGLIGIFGRAGFAYRRPACATGFGKAPVSHGVYQTQAIR